MSPRLKTVAYSKNETQNESLFSPSHKNLAPRGRTIKLGVVCWLALFWQLVNLVSDIFLGDAFFLPFW